MSFSQFASVNQLRRLDGKLDGANSRINDFMRAQAAGEEPDPAEFTAILEQRMIVQQAMQAQFKLHDKPLKTVLAEAR